MDANSRLPRLETVFGLGVAAIAFALGSRVVTDNSFLTHLATGRIITETGSIPRVDPYSYTAAGEPWVVQSWLASWLYAFGFFEIGEWTVRFLHGCLGAVAGYITWNLTDKTKNFLVRVFLVGIVIVLSAYMWSPRPLMFAVVGFAMVQAVLDKRIKMSWLLPVMWIWVNTHGSFPLAGVLAGTTMVGAWLDSRETPVFELKVLGFVTVGTLLGAINPLGLKLLWFPVTLLSQSQDKLHNVAEWQPISPSIPLAFFPFIALLVIFAAAVYFGARWRELVPVIVFSIATFTAVRNVGMAAAVLAVGASSFLPALSGTLTADLRSRFSQILGAVAVASAVLVLLIPLMDGTFQLDEYPTAEIDWLDDRNLMANPDVNVVANDTTGNFLTLKYGTDAKVFFDDRFDMYPLEINQAVDALFGKDEAEFARVLDTYEADIVIWRHDQTLGEWLIESDNWDVAFEGEDHVVVCRSTFDCLNAPKR